MKRSCWRSKVMIWDFEAAVLEKCQVLPGACFWHINSLLCENIIQIQLIMQYVNAIFTYSSEGDVFYKKRRRNKNNNHFTSLSCIIVFLPKCATFMPVSFCLQHIYFTYGKGKQPVLSMLVKFVSVLVFETKNLQHERTLRHWLEFVSVLVFETKNLQHKRTLRHWF